MSGSSINIACPKCSAQNELRGKAMTVALTCKSCGVYFRTGKWERHTIHFEHKEEPTIPLGSRGRVENFMYEVIGFVVKRERKYRYHWKEYLLFNPYRGYAFLSEYNGHWNFIWPIENPVRDSAESTFYLDGEQYRLYQKYSADVVFARGEFFFDVVSMTDATINYDYISPPHLLTLERSDDSLLWCKGEYFTRNEIGAIFNIAKDKLPKKEGLGYTEPIVGSFSARSLIIATIALLLIIALAQFVMTGTAEEKVVYHRVFNKEDLTDQKMFVTESFELSEGTKSVEFYIEAPLNNDWFYGEFAMVNEADGTEYNFSKDIEFYHGYEGGESWSEGSKVGEAYLSRIPGGKYHVNIYPEFSTYANSFTVIITRDVKSLANMFIACGVLLIFPIFYFIRRHYQEVKRWSDSDYSPYE